MEITTNIRARINTAVCGKSLTSNKPSLKYPTIRNFRVELGRTVCMNLSQSNLSQLADTTPNHPQSNAMDKPCLHPRVQVVSRDEDAEFVECLECREIFESSEFRDMDIESKISPEEE